MKLVHMDPQDDRKSPLLGFESTADDLVWLRDLRAMHLVPPNQMAAIEESYRKRFRNLTFTASTNPQTILKQVQECCCKWLKPESRNPAEIVDLVMMEQLYYMLPVRARERLNCHHGWSLDIVVRVMQDVLAEADVRHDSRNRCTGIVAAAGVEDQCSEESVAVTSEITAMFEKTFVQDFQNTRSSVGIENGEGIFVEDLQLSVVEETVEDQEEPSIHYLQNAKNSEELEEAPFEEDRPHYEVEKIVEMEKLPVHDLPCTSNRESIEGGQGLSTEDRQLSVVEESIEEEASLMDYQDSLGHVNIDAGESLHAFLLQDYVVEVSTDERRGLSPIDIYDTIEEWDECSASDYDSDGSCLGMRSIDKWKENYDKMPVKLRPHEALSGENQLMAVDKRITNTQNKSQAVRIKLAEKRCATKGTSCTNQFKVPSSQEFTCVSQGIQQGDKLSKRGMSFLPQLSVEILQEAETANLQDHVLQGGQNLGDPTAFPTFCLKPALEPFACTECGEIFLDELNLKEHQQIHKKETLCGSTYDHVYTQRVNENNQVSELLYRYNERGKGFRTSPLLAAQLLLHTGPDPYLCSECGQSFHQSSSLIAHQKLHPVKKPYVCSECGKSFSSRSYLTSHLQTYKYQHKAKNYFRSPMQNRAKPSLCHKRK
ncbi:zinc finger and SCAN domain-containing protein 30-like isoform X2 [Ambystoma mexicanum]|uniref:zinc finger and SCAN domain-containing protein 30-like isoform X2 n=1 Tax=Ambystoma mexicanum TaxID=8296 RepID=UPI0037E79845